MARQFLRSTRRGFLLGTAAVVAATSGHAQFVGAGSAATVPASDPPAMLAASPNGIASDFTQGVDGRRCATKTAGVISYSAGVDAFLTNSQNMQTPTRIQDSAGVWSWSAHNLFTNPNAPANQTVAAPLMVIGETYVVVATSTASFRVTGASPTTQVTSANSPFVFVATTATLTVNNISGSGTMQLNRGATPTAYLASSTGPAFACPVSYGLTGEGPFLLDEPRADQFLDNNLSPLAQTKSLVANTYTAQCGGSGRVDVTISGVIVGSATKLVPYTFTVATTTSVTFTPSGSVDWFQCTNLAVATSQIPTYTAPARRDRPLMSFLLSAVPSFAATAAAVFYDFDYQGALDNCYLGGLAADSGNYVAARIDAGGLVKPRVKVATAEQFIGTLDTTAPANTRQQLTIGLRSNRIRATLTGAPFGQGGINTSTITMPTPTVCWVGSVPGEGAQQGVFRFYRLAVISDDVPSHQLSSRFYNYTTDPTPYDVISDDGQSNAYFGIGLDPVIDVAGPFSFQLNADTGQLTPANEPLNVPVPAPGYIGTAVAFCRDYYCPNTGRKALILPNAISNTGFFDNRWNPGNDLYERRANMTGIALARFPNARLKLRMWQQGEREAAQSWTQSQYAAAFDAMVAADRADFPGVPYLVGSMVPPYVAANPTWQPVQNALVATATRLTKTAFVSAGSLGISTDVHYTAADHRAYAPAWWTAWLTL